MQTLKSHPQEFNIARFRSDLPRQSAQIGYLLAILEPTETTLPIKDKVALITSAFKAEALAMGARWKKPMTGMKLVAYKESPSTEPGFMVIELAYELSGEAGSAMYGKVHLFNNLAVYFFDETMVPVEQSPLDDTWIKLS